jgi:very-long-chain enoyl-CoA reductase
LKDDKKLKDVLGGIIEGGELQVKDLGPQVSWRTVFLAEYVCINHFTVGQA